MEVLRTHDGAVPIAVRSYGTLDLGPVPALPDALRAAARLDIDLSAHRARALSTGDLESADLAIGFEPFHAAAAVVTGGIDKGRAFLIAELAEVLDDLRGSRTSPAAPPLELLAAADERRRGAFRVPQSVADPVGGTPELFLETFVRVRLLVQSIGFCLLGDGAADRDR